MVFIRLIAYNISLKITFVDHNELRYIKTKILVQSPKWSIFTHIYLCYFRNKIMLTCSHFRKLDGVKL